MSLDIARQTDALGDGDRHAAPAGLSRGDLVGMPVGNIVGKAEVVEVNDAKPSRHFSVCRLKFATNARLKRIFEDAWIPSTWVEKLPFQKGDYVFCFGGARHIRGTCQVVSGLFQNPSENVDLPDCYQFESGFQLSAKFFRKISAREAELRHRHLEWCSEEIRLAEKYGTVESGIWSEYVRPLLENCLADKDSPLMFREAAKRVISCVYRLHRQRSEV